MATEQRLPTVNGDDGEWGGHLNAFLSKEHYTADANVTYPGTSTNGSHKTVTIQPGTATAGTAPLKFTSGTLLTTPEPGAVEFGSNKLYYTVTGPTRRTIASYAESTGAEGDTYYRDNSGNFVPLTVGGTNTVMKVSGGLPSWQTTGTAININLSVGTSAPGSPATGDLWIDTN